MAFQFLVTVPDSAVVPRSFLAEDFPVAEAESAESETRDANAAPPVARQVRAEADEEDLVRVDMMQLLRVMIHDDPYDSLVKQIRILKDCDGYGHVVMFRVWSAAAAEAVTHGLQFDLGIGSDALPQCGSVTVIPVEIARPHQSREETVFVPERLVPRGSSGNVSIQPAAANSPTDSVAAGAVGRRDAGGEVPASETAGSVRGLAAMDDLPQVTVDGGKAAPTNFRDSVASRILLDKLLEQLAAGSALTFDYLALAIAASIIAGIGLGTDNVVAIVASMLVSPLMGPIVAITFGIFVFDGPLLKQGLATEAIGLACCVCTGFLTGLVFAPFAEDSVTEWPTDEMEGRGQTIGLLIGFTIAVPSGFGVGLSVTGNNTMSLVGVAISAALLPPLVNAGMCWAYAFAGVTFLRDRDINVGRYGQLGAISFGLTIMNIACVIITAIIMFKVWSE